MKHYFFLSLILVASCSYDVELRDMDSSDRLFVTCFPGERDTMRISLSVVTPANVDPAAKHPKNLFLEMNYNNENVAISRSTSEDGNCYYAVLPSELQGTISMRAFADGIEAVRAESVFPSPPATDISYREEDGYINFQIIIKDDPAINNWYGLRFHRKEETMEYCENYGFFSRNKTELFIKTPWQILGEGDGLTYDDFLQGRMRRDINGEEMFLFTDKEAQNKNIIINLLVDYSSDYINSYISREYQDAHYKQLIVTRYFNEIEVFSLSKDMYKYFETMFKIENNELAGLGLAPASFAAGNVFGGYGVVGCCNKFSSGWLHNVDFIPECDDFEDAWRLTSGPKTIGVARTF